MKKDPLAGIGNFFREINDYWFGYGSPVTIGVMRILIGITVFCNLLIMFIGYDDWYTERGYVPVGLNQMYLGKVSKDFVLFGSHQMPFEIPRFNLLDYLAQWFATFHVHFPLQQFTFAMWIITLVACITMTLGLWSRASAIILAICIVTIHHRNAMILHGGDTVQRIAVLYMALAPCGAACSLDRLIGLYKGKIQPGAVRVSLWPQRLIAFNIALIYFTTVWMKWGGNYWKSGIATWFPARLNEFKRFPVPDFVNNYPFVKLTTYGTLATELAMATLVFYKPLRKYVLLGGIMMHGFIEYSMNIPMFSFSICALYLTFYEGEEVTEWAKRWGQRLKQFSIRVMLPANKMLRVGPAAALSAADPLGLVSYEAGDGERWTAVTPDGRQKNPFLSSRVRSIGGWVIAIVPGLWRRMLQQGTIEATEDKPPVKKRPRADIVNARR